MSLPIIITSGIIAYLVITNKKKTKVSTTEKSDSKIGSNDIGYEIINCNTLIIYDANKSYLWANNLGTDEALKIKNMQLDDQGFNPEKLLLGNCFESNKKIDFESPIDEIEKEKIRITELVKKAFNNKIKVKFIFELFKHLYSGYAKIDEASKEFALNNLKKLRNSFKESGYDTNNLIVGLY